MKLCVKILFIVLFSSFIGAQEPFHLNYTIENGLPSNEVYCVYQDTTGYIWFGTDNGVSRYDGYTFENYGLEDGLDKLEINQILPDYTGKVWFSSFFGKVYYREGNRFCPYRWNNILEKYKKISNLVNLQHIDQAGTFFFKVKYIGILLIYQDGREQIIQSDCGSCEVILKSESGFLMVEGILQKHHPDFLSHYNNALEKGERKIHVYEMKNIREYKEILKNEPYSSNNSQIYQWNDSLTIYSLYKQIYIINGGKFVPVLTTTSPVNIYFKDNSDLYIGHQKNDGLHIYRNWNPNLQIKPEKWLSGSEISWVLRDSNQGLWVTSINHGVYYFPNDKMKIYANEGNEKNLIFTALLPLGFGDVAAVNYDGILIFLKNYQNDLQIQFEDRSNIPDISQNEEFTFIRGFRLNKKSEYLFYKTNFPSRYERKRKFKSFYGADRTNLFLYNPKTKIFDIIFDEKLNSDFIFDLYRDDQNTLWIATNVGLKTYKDNKLNNVVPSLQNIKTISIDQLKTGQMIIGTKGKGIYIYDQNSDLVHQIQISQGLSSDLIEYIWVDDFDNIWVATLKGLNKINITPDQVIKVRQYHKQHGLPSEEINMVRTYGKDIWLATGKGLVFFRDTPLDTTTFKPDLIQFFVNGKISTLRDVFAHDENNIRIALKNFDFACGNKIKYRYQLKNGDVWTEQTSNILNFINLAPGAYRLEVQAKNKDGFWSDSYILPFIINRPWWLSWPFLIFVAFIFGLLIYVYFTRRVQSIRSEQQLKNKMMYYEKQALLAQMNPHFIFNAFSAIQYYINTNETHKADDYLTDLSTLIRRILDNSRKKDIFLSEEIDLLKLYSSLEEKRFDQKFKVIFEIDEEIETESLKIPGMLLQPIVENAINHGLMHLKVKDGRLKISFQLRNDQTLRCIIEDNGIGIKTAQNLPTEKTHQSMGITLLNERIASYANSGEYHIKTEYIDLQEETGESGTKVLVDIQWF